MNSNAQVIGLSKGTIIKSKPWKTRFSDFYSNRGMLGFIVLATDLVMENNIIRLTPEGVGLSFSRIPCKTDVNNTFLRQQLAMLPSAAAMIQPDKPPDLVCYACTSGSILNGEQNCMDAIKVGAPHSKSMTLVTGVVDAMKTLGALNIVVGTPYLDEVNSVELDFLIDSGFNVLDIQGLNVSDGAEMGRIDPQFIKEFAISIDRPDAECIFLSCGGIRSIDVIDQIEAEIDKPVITSNQAMIWSCLRRIGVEDNISGYGQLFKAKKIKT